MREGKYNKMCTIKLVYVTLPKRWWIAEKLGISTRSYFPHQDQIFVRKLFQAFPTVDQILVDRKETR